MSDNFPSRARKVNFESFDVTIRQCGDTNSSEINNIKAHSWVMEAVAGRGVGGREVAL